MCSLIILILSFCSIEKSIPVIVKAINAIRPRPDENGYISMQLYDVMNIFEPYVFCGKNVVFDANSISFREEDLKPTKSSMGLKRYLKNNK